MPRTIVFLGSPGSGKGTQASLLEQRRGFAHFDMGQSFRDEIRRKGPMASELETYIRKGHLVPINLVEKFVWKFLNENRLRDIVLDGFPRSEEQVELLDKLLSDIERELSLAIVFEISEEELKNRILNRLSCANCGAVFNLALHPPKVDGLCDFCGSQLVRREDDDIRVILERNRVYLSECSPVLELYKRRNILKRINGKGEVEEVYKRVEEAIFNE